MNVFLTIVTIYLAIRFLGLARHVWDQGYSFIWVGLELVSALLCLLFLWPIWG